MLPPPENFVYNAISRKLSWETIPGADTYWIEFCINDGLDNWLPLYHGTDTSCPFIQPPGLYKTKGKTGDDGTWGKPTIITITN